VAALLSGAYRPAPDERVAVVISGANLPLPELEDDPAGQGLAGG
jgi:hypothetical protein